MDTIHSRERTGTVRPIGGSREGAPREAQQGGCWVLGGETHRRFIGSLVATAAPGWVVTLDKPTRTRLQNNYLHALLTDIAEQLPAPDGTGEFHDKEWWKPRCTLQWLLDKAEAGEVITSLDGRRKFGLLVPHTSDLNTAECAELCDWIIAFGALNGVRFSNPKWQDHAPARMER